MLPTQVPALGRREVIFHDDAVDVVGFVLQAPSEHAGAFHRDWFAELVLALAYCEVRPGDWHVGAWE